MLDAGCWVDRGLAGSLDLLLTCCGHNYRIEETRPEDLQTEIQSPEDTKSHAVSVPNQA